MPIENPQAEQLKKVNEIDNKLDNIDNKFDQKNEEFSKEMESVKKAINDLSNQYDTFDQRLKTAFDGLKKDFNDLSIDANINSQSYYNVDKISSLNYSEDDVFNNEILFNSVHANWSLLPDKPVMNFKNILKDHLEKGGEINWTKIYEVDSNFKCQNLIDNWTNVFRVPGDYVTDIKSWQKLTGNNVDITFGSV